MSRVLLLEDDTFSALALSSLLEEEGFEVRCFSSSDVALSSALQEVPDIVIADWSIEGSVTSSDVARRLRTLNPDIRVVFVTGYDSEEIKGQVADLQPCMVFAKPLDFDHFISEMKHVDASTTNGQAGCRQEPAAKLV
jgi:DNA-binding response OmpR family regulator